MANVYTLYASSQQDLPRFLRIGLTSHLNEQPQINIYSYNLEIGRFLNNNNDGYFSSMGFATSNGRFIATPSWASFLRLNYEFGTFSAAQNASQGYANAVPALMQNGQWGVYLLSNPQNIAATYVYATSQRIILSNENGIVLVSDNELHNLQFRDISRITSLGSRSYRGIIELGRFSGNNITAVNIIDIEDYLLSVVPAEMPASWHMEALKAQTVAARSYALNRIGSFSQQGFDLVDTVFSQVYPGTSSEHYRSNEAVRLTRGIVMFFNNRPVEAVYFSSSGGFTENSEHVWISAVPYLRAVSERYEPTAMQWERYFTLSQISNLLSWQNINIGSISSIELGLTANGRVQEFTILGNNGTHTISGEAIRGFFSPLGSSLESRNFTITNGIVASTNRRMNVNTFSPTSDTQNFNIQQPPIFVLNGQAITQANAGDIFNVQNNFTINVASAFGQTYIIGQNSNYSIPIIGTIGNYIVQTISHFGYNIHITGAGWGHGVGMSQHGANNMANIGYNFREILLWYYNGVEIRQQ